MCQSCSAFLDALERVIFALRMLFWWLLARIFRFTNKNTLHAQMQKTLQIYRKKFFVELHFDKTRHRALKTTFTKNISRRNIYKRLL